MWRSVEALPAPLPNPSPQGGREPAAFAAKPMTAYFVTSTGTDIGKTFVTAGLIRHLRGAGAGVDALKPVVSGYDSSVVETSDPAVLLEALGRPVSAKEIERMAPWRFRAPLSPDLAAAREGREIDFDALVGFSRSAVEAASGLLFIEGVGGIMVPLDARRTVLDWMAGLRIPLLVRGPGIKAGSVPEQFVANIDLAPTFLDLAGLPIPKSMQGRSIAPLLRGESPADWRNSVYYRYYHDPGNHNTAAHLGVRTATHKLIYYWKKAK